MDVRAPFVTAHARDVLILRPRSEADETAEAVSARGWRPLVAPILEIVATPPQAFERPQAVIVSSTRAVAHAPTVLLDVPAFAVGARTAEAWRERGGPVIAQALQGAALAPKIAAAGFDRILHVCGRDFAFDFGVRRLIVYEARLRALTAQARAALRSGQATALLTSPRIAEALAAEGTGIRAVAMSRNIADAWVRAGGGPAAIAAEPTLDALLDRLGQPDDALDRSG